MSFFKSLTKFEWLLWGCSLLVVGVASLIAPDASWLSVLASLIGVTALIFLAKGHVMGQFLIVVFAALYGIISFQFRYYGEMITYLGMSAPMAICAAICPASSVWIRHTQTDSISALVSPCPNQNAVTVRSSATQSEKILGEYPYS